MESKDFYVRLSAVRIEIGHIPLLCHYKCEYSLVIGKNFCDIRQQNSQKFTATYFAEGFQLFSLRIEKLGKEKYSESVL